MIRRRGKRGRIRRAEANEAYENHALLTNDRRRLPKLSRSRGMIRPHWIPDRPFSISLPLTKTCSPEGLAYPQSVYGLEANAPELTPSFFISSACKFALIVWLCHYGAMAKTVIVKLTDDIDGGDAEETVYFSLDGKSYEIDVNEANADRVRSAFEPFIAKARPSGGGGGGRPRPVRSSAGSSEKTLFSQLSADEKTRFRAWANMATARRISDSRVNSWVEAGKP
jgi:hypothetical protein